MDKFFNKYLNEGPSKKQEGPKTPRDAQKAVEALAAQLAVQVLDLDSKYHSKGGKLKKFIGDAEDKVQAAISKLHPDPRVISHFLNTYEKLVGKTITNEIPGRASNVIKSRANIGIDYHNSVKNNADVVGKIDNKVSSFDPVQYHVDLALKTGEEDIEKLTDIAYYAGQENNTFSEPPLPQALPEHLVPIMNKYLNEGPDKPKKPTSVDLAKKFGSKPSDETIAWWNSRSEETQKAHIAEEQGKKDSDSPVLYWFKKHVLVPGKKYGSEEQSGPAQDRMKQSQKVREIQAKKQSTDTKVPKDKHEPTEPTEIKDKKEKAQQTKRSRAQEKAQEKIDNIEDVFEDNPNLGETVEVDDEDANYVFDPASIYKIKDTTLDPMIKTAETDAFKKSNLQSDDEWTKTNKKNERKTKIALPQKFRYNSKIPPKYIDVLERMLNSKKNKATSSITHFIPGSAGAGTIDSQSGEIVMFVASTMREDEWNEMRKLMEDHIDNTSGEGTSIITKEWIKAADDNRQALYKRLRGEYPDMVFPDDIEAGCWDVKEEVEAMGLKDYKTNKGFSTDVYFKIKPGKDKDPILIQQSLKKSYKVNFINGGTGRLEIWNPNLPEELKLSNFSARQKEALTSFGKEYRDDIERFFKEKQMLPDDNYKKLVGYIGEPPNIDKLLSGSNRDNRHAMNLVLQMMNTEKSMAKYEEIDKMGKDYCENCVNAIMNDPQMMEGLMFDVRSEFPLKSVFTGEEGMSIGDSSLDKAVLSEIFGVNSWEEAKERLIVSKDKNGKPCLLYIIEGKAPIKVAEIKVREDGVTYGGSVKLEMSLHNDFSKKLKEANDNLYGNKRIVANSLKSESYRYGFRRFILNENIFMKKYLFGHK